MSEQKHKRKRKEVCLLLLCFSFLALFGLSKTQKTKAQDLSVNANFQDETVTPDFKIVLTLNRTLTSTEGRLAFFISDIDFSSLFVESNNKYSYQPDVLLLPLGENSMKIYLVEGQNVWRKIAEFTLRVDKKTAADVSIPQTSSPPTSTDSNSSVSTPTQEQKRRYGFDKAEFKPSLTINFKPESTILFFPDTYRPQRINSADFDLQASLQTEVARGKLVSNIRFDFVGTSYQQAALRFGELSNNAPHIDLSSYLMQFQIGKAKFQAGHISFGTHKHLANSFSSRGLAFTFPIKKRVDVTLAATNGTNIVGYDNFFGLNRRKHQLLSATIGFEFLKERPGGLRLEVSGLSSSLLPFTSFNQNSVTDAERGRGIGVRFIGSNKDGRIRFDGGFVRNRFANPSDPFLNQGFNVVEVRPVTRSARYVEASFNFLKDIDLMKTKKLNATFGFRHEKVDPLFRTATAAPQADRFDNQFDFSGSFGELNFAATHQRFNDNLLDIKSILKTLTRRTAFNVGLPASFFFSNANGKLSWLPRASFNYDRVHQYGAFLPVNSDFSSPSQVPDQLSISQSFNLESQLPNNWRVGYRFNRSAQDNRQPGRERADLKTTTNTLSFGLKPLKSLETNFEVNWESARNFEQSRTDRVFRLGTGIIWTLPRNFILNANLSTTVAGDLQDFNDSRNAEFDVQLAWRFMRGKEGSLRKVQGQFFVRFLNRYAFTKDNQFGFTNLTKIQAANAGISFTFF